VTSTRPDAKNTPSPAPTPEETPSEPDDGQPDDAPEDTTIKAKTVRALPKARGKRIRKTGHSLRTGTHPHVACARVVSRSRAGTAQGNLLHILL